MRARVRVRVGGGEQRGLDVRVEGVVVLLEELLRAVDHVALREMRGRYAGDMVEISSAQ